MYTYQSLSVFLHYSQQYKSLHTAHGNNNMQELKKTQEELQNTRMLLIQVLGV